jgi:BioD-like phosphotransacetylase family protein
MPTLYIASTETFVGKSAVCMGLLHRMQQDGYTVGYMKPLSVQAQAGEEQDTALIKQTFHLPAALDDMAPVLMTPSVIESILHGKRVSYVEQVQQAFATVASGTDIMIVEGSNSWAEGALIGLSAPRVIEMLNATSLLVSRYRGLHTVDIVLSVKRYLPSQFSGVLLNQVEPPQVDYVRREIVPFLEREGIPVLGVLPQDPLLSSVSVADLAEHLNAQFIGEKAWCDKPVESLMIGAMNSEAGLSFFRRRPRKAVITGGDRVDLQLVALETDTSVLVLSGNMGPMIKVIERAEDRQIPILVVAEDTLTTVEKAEQLFGKVRFHQPAKFDRFVGMMNAGFDFVRLYNILEITPRP